MRYLLILLLLAAALNPAPAKSQVVRHNLGFGISVETPSDWVVQEAADRISMEDSLANAIPADQWGHFHRLLKSQQGSRFLIVAMSPDTTTWYVNISAGTSDPVSPLAYQRFSPSERQTAGSGMCEHLASMREHFGRSLTECEWEWVRAANRLILIAEYKLPSPEGAASKGWTVSFPAEQVIVSVTLEAAPYSLPEADTVARQIISSVILPDP